MKLHDLLAHHGIVANPLPTRPQTDPRLQGPLPHEHLPPAWDKVYGDPSSPATSIVFGEKGAGKTAMRLQMAGQIDEHNAQNDNGRLFVIEYDDFNPFLDRFADRLSGRKQRNPAKVLAEWKLWDHMDAILSLGVTSLVDRLLGVPQPERPGRQPDQRRPTLRNGSTAIRSATCCCSPPATTTRSPRTFQSRWNRLRRKLRLLHLADAGRSGCSASS